MLALVLGSVADVVLVLVLVGEMETPWHAPRLGEECDPERGRMARETVGRVYALLTGLIHR